MTLEQINAQLKQHGKPVAKQATPKPTRPDIASLRQRITDVRKQIGAAFEQAQRLRATELAARIRALSQQLVGLEASLAQVSGVERRLVRLINKI